ncbi:MAG: endonuclease/exonuclease/phosphatase family protein [Candidatus Rokubacteria bacterium]|nr:endonuclease/exonuclease/phosphatase family protein [Candidatus Rokubacteria bacterium]MBI3827100.1 endonuclease/exonuclease/phosphatase family protein [Candidatus Rokubacteria bacterium]
MKTLVVASYNIHRGVGLDRRRDLGRIADVIAEIGPDVIGLQEVIRAGDTAHLDQAMHLASKLGMEFVMGATRSHGAAGIYGNAVLTRWPVVGSARCDISHGRREPRGCLRVDVDVDGVTLHVFNAHFGLALRERRAQLELLGAFMAVSSGLLGPRLLMGDFNEWHRGPITRGLRREFSSPIRRMRRTHPAIFPLFRLDRIYWDVELEGQEFHVHRTRLSRVASDHLPVVARLRLLHPGPEPYVTGEKLPPPE